MSGKDENDMVNMLKQKINLQDLGEGAVFEVDTLNYDDALDKAEENESYSEKEFEENISRLALSVLDEDNVTELRGTPGSTDFSTIALRMTDLYPSLYGSKIKKMVLQEGEGPVVPWTSLVEVHYNVYFEHSDEPYDSTVLRGQPFKFIPNNGDCVAGLTFGIVTMKKKEISQFLVHPDLGYGKMGVPPRIPANAELLFEVEILNYIDGVEGNPLGENLEEELNVLKKATAKYLEGNERFRNRNYTEAIVKYKKALSLIENARQGNKEDEKARMELIPKLFTNLALCYTKKRSFPHAVKMSRRALDIEPNYCKALFQLGRALLMMGEFDEAKVELLKAQKLEPTNMEVNKQILNLENQLKAYNVKTKQMTERMFTIPKTKTEENVNVNGMSKWSRYLTAFLNDNSDTNLSLPTALTTEEMDSLESDASNLGLIVTAVNDKIIIKKPKKAVLRTPLC